MVQLYHGSQCGPTGETTANQIRWRGSAANGLAKAKPAAMRAGPMALSHLLADRSAQPSPAVETFSLSNNSKNTVDIERSALIRSSSRTKRAIREGQKKVKEKKRLKTNTKEATQRSNSTRQYLFTAGQVTNSRLNKGPHILYNRFEIDIGRRSTI